MTDMTKSELLQWIIEKVGVPTAALGVILWMIGSAGSTLHDSVVQPFMSSHTKFLDSTQETQSRQADALEVMAAAQETHARAEGQQTQILGEIVEAQELIKAAIERIPHPAPPKGK
jgi:hypothetical protein